MSAKRNIQWSHYINYIIIGAIAITLSAISLAGGQFDRSFIDLIEKITISIILAVSLSIVVGFLGELSLGHAGFMCVGAFIGGKFANLLLPTLGNSPTTLILSLLVGGTVAAVFGVIIGIPALRLRGDYLAIVTLAFGEIVRSVFQNVPEAWFGGNLGLTTPRYDRNSLFIYAFLMVLLVVMVAQNFVRSKHGRAVTSIRDNEIAARACGINVTKYKLLAFTISAFFAGIAGVLFSFSQPNKIVSTSFDYNYSIEILVMVVLGGMGNINGAILAATLITFIQTKLGTVLTGDMAVLQNLIYALILIVIVVYNNAPGLKNFRERYNLKALINKIIKQKQDPSKRADDEAKWDVVPTKIEMNEILSIDMKPQNLGSDKPQKGGRN